MPTRAVRPKTSGRRITHAQEDTMNRSKSFVTGLVIAGLLALADVTTPLTSDGEHPPMVIGVACAVLGLISIAGIVGAWRGSRWLDDRDHRLAPAVGGGGRAGVLRRRGCRPARWRRRVPGSD
jgi:hypothetical protein